MSLLWQTTFLCKNFSFKVPPRVSKSGANSKSFWLGTHQPTHTADVSTKKWAFGETLSGHSSMDAVFFAEDKDANSDLFFCVCFLTQKRNLSIQNEKREKSDISLSFSPKENVSREKRGKKGKGGNIMHDYKSKEIWEHELGRGEEQGEKQGQTLLKRSAARCDNGLVVCQHFECCKTA